MTDLTTNEERTLEQEVAEAPTIPTPPTPNVDIGGPLQGYGCLQPTISVPDVYEMELDLATGQYPTNK